MKTQTLLVAGLEQLRVARKGPGESLVLIRGRG